jgi:nicotinic acid mononucleotide adenylyltransferase
MKITVNDKKYEVLTHQNRIYDMWEVWIRGEDRFRMVATATTEEKAIEEAVLEIEQRHQWYTDCVVQEAK